jgi:mannitol-1-phosphate 5-dehydrogenase
MSEPSAKRSAPVERPSAGGRVVIIGPGKLGCGYLAPLFLSAGWETVLVARTRARAERIRAWGGFRVRRAPGGESELATTLAIPFGRTEFQRAVADADLIVTAVGVENIGALGPGLALGLGARSQSAPIDVWVVENANVAPALEASVRRAASQASVALPHVGFAGAIAYPIVACGDWDGEEPPTFVRDGGGDGLLVDTTRLVGALPDVPGLCGTPNYEARLREKLFVFGAGHALCAYLGACCGYRRLDEAAHDPLLRSVVKECLLEARSALELSHPDLDGDGWAAVTDAMHRYANEGLCDPIRRVARSPMRKLSPSGPLVGGAKLVRHVFGRVSMPYALGIASGLLYRDEADGQSRELAGLLRRHGVEGVLQRVCDLDPADSFFRAVVIAYERMRRSGARRTVRARREPVRAPRRVPVAPHLGRTAEAAR